MDRRQFLARAGSVAVVGGLWPSWAGCSPCRGWEEDVAPAYAPWTDPPEATAVRRVVAAGILAANPHNTQPWRFVALAEGVAVEQDLTRSLGAMDPLGREQIIGLGCAEENVRLASVRDGLLADDPRFPTDALLAAIPHRHTNRAAYEDAPLPAGVRAELDAMVGEASGVELHWLEAEEDRAQFREETVWATEEIVADEEMNTASHAWWRQTAEDIVTHRDGLTLDATGNPRRTRVVAKCLAAPSAEKAGRYWIRNTEGRETTGSAFCILSTVSLTDPLALRACGQIYQRLHLLATHLDLAMQPLNQLAERRDRAVALGTDASGRDSRAGRVLAAWTGARHAQMLFRIGLPTEPSRPSPRRPVDWVLG